MFTGKNMEALLVICQRGRNGIDEYLLKSYNDTKMSKSALSFRSAELILKWSHSDIDFITKNAQSIAAEEKNKNKRSSL